MSAVWSERNGRRGGGRSDTTRAASAALPRNRNRQAPDASGAPPRYKDRQDPDASGPPPRDENRTRMCEYPRVESEPKILAQGRYLTLIDDNGWEYVTRVGVSGVAVIVAVTEEAKLVLVEQYRPAVRKRVVELPAGLGGDVAGRQEESMREAAGRELEEETGYRASDLLLLFEGPIAVGV